MILTEPSAFFPKATTFAPREPKGSVQSSAADCKKSLGFRGFEVWGASKTPLSSACNNIPEPKELKQVSCLDCASNGQDSSWDQSSSCIPGVELNLRLGPYRFRSRLLDIIPWKTGLFLHSLHIFVRTSQKRRRDLNLRLASSSLQPPANTESCCQRVLQLQRRQCDVSKAPSHVNSLLEGRRYKFEV